MTPSLGEKISSIRMDAIRPGMLFVKNNITIFIVAAVTQDDGKVRLTVLNATDDGERVLRQWDAFDGELLAFHGGFWRRLG